jgi:hypothetical protein
LKSFISVLFLLQTMSLFVEVYHLIIGTAHPATGDEPGSISVGGVL